MGVLIIPAESVASCVIVESIDVELAVRRCRRSPSHLIVVLGQA